MTGRLFNIQHFSIHDGPGIRTTLFFKGCNLRCFWCHNPESWSISPEMQFDAARCIKCGKCTAACPKSDGTRTAIFTDSCDNCGRCAEVCYAGAVKKYGRDYTVDEILGEVLRDRDLYEKTGGGVTCSGGEPFLQPVFLSELLSGLKSEGIHTVLESAACVGWHIIEAVLPYIDLFICDMKSAIDEKHIAATSLSNRLILENIKMLSRNGKKLLLRTPIIPGFNDSDADLEAIADFIASLPNVPEYELLPFSRICKGKYSALNRSYPAENLTPPDAEHMERCADIFRRRKIICKINDV